MAMTYSEEQMALRKKKMYARKEPLPRKKVARMPKSGLEKKGRTEAVSSETSSSSGRQYTVSVALPGSILENAQSHDLRSYLAGQVARALTIFSIDEVVVYDEAAQLTSSDCDHIERGHYQGNSGNALMVKILRFLECPQYLRKHLFPLSPDLRSAGLLNPLNSLHHLEKDEVSFPFREAVVVDKPPKQGHGSWCYAGLKREVQIDKVLVPGTRVTLEVVDKEDGRKWGKAKVVSPAKPVKTTGRYWGYNVRLAKSLNAALSESRYDGGYDLLIGTSDKGRNVNEIVLPHFEYVQRSGTAVAVFMARPDRLWRTEGDRELLRERSEHSDE